MVTGLCIWGIVSVLKRADSVGSYTPTIADLNAMVKVNPVLALILAVCLFSLAGIPPLVGFYAKLGIFQSALNSGFFSIASFIILTSVVSTFYYIRLIKSAYFESVYVRLVPKCSPFPRYASLGGCVSFINLQCYYCCTVNIWSERYMTRDIKQYAE